MSCVISAHYVYYANNADRRRREENEDHDDSQVRGNPNYLRSAAVTATVTREKKNPHAVAQRKQQLLIKKESLLAQISISD